MNLAIILAFGTMFLFGIGDFFIQKATRKIGSKEMLVFIGVIGSIVLLPFLLMDLSVFSDWKTVVFLIVLGGFGVSHAFLIIKAFEVGKLSVVEVVAQIELPITIVLSILFLKEHISLYQIALIIVVLAGLIFASVKSWRDWRGNIEKGVIIAAISGILMGIDNFLTGFAAKNISPMMALALPWIAFMIVAFIVARKSGETKNIVLHAKKHYWIILIAALANVVGWICFVFAVEENSVALVGTIAEGYVIVALLLGMFVNKERIRINQGIGIALALIGVILLTMTF